MRILVEDFSISIEGYDIVSFKDIEDAVEIIEQNPNDILLIYYSDDLDEYVYDYDINAVKIDEEKYTFTNVSDILVSILNMLNVTNIVRLFYDNE